MREIEFSIEDLDTLPVFLCLCLCLCGKMYCGSVRSIICVRPQINKKEVQDPPTLFTEFAGVIGICGCYRVCACLVLFLLECTLRGLFLAHAAAGLHCTVRSVTPPWAG